MTPTGNVTHSSSDLQQIYHTRFAGRTEYRKQVWQTLISFFARWIPQNAAVLDLGAGYCEFINNVNARTKFAMDFNPDVFQMAGPGVAVLHQDCSQPWAIADDSLDAVFTSNFFEHLPTKTDLERTVIEAVRALKTGGRLIAMGPNIKYVRGAYWDFFDHYLPLTELSLIEVLKKSGLQIEWAVARFLPYTMSDGRKYPLFALRAYLAVPLAWRIFGRQFLVVARKTTPLSAPTLLSR